MNLGKTVESYRIALDRETQKWSGFARALRKEDRVAFDQMMDACRNSASAGSNATRPVMFEPMVMSNSLGTAEAIEQVREGVECS